ncbi:plasma-membrane proton-efflux P-type ATPase [Cetobacterium sp.]|uniref:plasma-membrane proton-efflux P-type ATPase n=2 Tax=Bacteria TaxID=2 RepID=UPI0025B99DA7|nr:plasma-membrane proton-efflux P-type ATPase [Cetobacterium sp.]
MDKISNEDLLKKLETDEKKGLNTSEVQNRLLRNGKNTLEEKKVTLLQKLMPYFWGPIPWMIEAAIVLSLITMDIKDFIIILLLLLLNAFIGWRQDKSAQDALAALKNDLALKANVLRDSKWQDIPASDLVVGDIVAVALGNVVPADAQILSGDYLTVDQSALTGESLPVTKNIQDVVYSGSIAKEGSVIVVVTATGVNTYFGKTAKLVAEAGAKSQLTGEITSVGNFLIIGVVVLSIILVTFQLILIRPLDQVTILRIVKTVLVLMVATIPVAMPAVISVTIALGALQLSKMKAIVSKLNSIEALASVNVLCSDKTGTLTQNKLSIAGVFPVEGITSELMTIYGVLASDPKGEDVIDLAIKNFLKSKDSLSSYKIDKFIPFNPVIKRVEAVVEKDGKTFHIVKGAPQVIVEMCKLTGDNLKNVRDKIDELASHGFKSLGLASGDGETWNYMGTFSLADPLRIDSKSTVQALKAEGIDVKMITGDSQNIAKEVANQLEIGDNILLATDVFGTDDKNMAITSKMQKQVEEASGFAEVFPQHKYEIVKVLQSKGHICAMTGDGVNDSPALKQADCGIAVSGATDAARAAAALILTNPGLSVIENAVNEAKKIFSRMMSYIYYRIAMTINIMIFSVIVTLIGKYLIHRVTPIDGNSFFPLTAIMLVSLALLDDIPIMTIAYDNAEISSGPSIWNKKRVFTVSFVLGIISVVQSIALVVWADRSWSHIISFSQLQTLVFLQLVVGGHLLLFITRRSGWFFTRPFPQWKLFLAIVLTQIFVVFMTYFGWLVESITIRDILYVWGYNILWMFPLSFISIIVKRIK